MPREVLKRLELPYRTMLLCTGDMGFAAGEDLRHRSVAAEPEDVSRDLVVQQHGGVPGAAREHQVPRRRHGRRREFVHTLNGSGLAVGRTLIAILENYQQQDGSVVVPAALRQHMAGQEVIQPAG